MHDNFWNLGTYLAENVLLSTMIRKEDSTNDNNGKPTKWLYHFFFDGNVIHVCKTFLCKVFNVGKARIETVQKKLSTNTTLDDNRGKHDNHIQKLTDEVKTVIQSHCESLPHSESHYSRENSKLNYFDSSDLTLVKLYELFIDYYASVTGKSEIPLDFSTYSKYFNHSVNFSFKMPRTDICNICSAYEVETIDENQYTMHKRQVELYKELKKLMMSVKNVLHLEFDFAQNLPLPKLAVNVQFFCRLLWLHVFNVHVHNNSNLKQIITKKFFCIPTVQVDKIKII